MYSHSGRGFQSLATLTVNGRVLVGQMRYDRRGNHPKGLEDHGLGVRHQRTVCEPDVPGSPDHGVRFLLYAPLHVRPVHQEPQGLDDEVRDGRMTADNILQREQRDVQIESVVPVRLRDRFQQVVHEIHGFGARHPGHFPLVEYLGLHEVADFRTPRSYLFEMPTVERRQAG